MIEMTHPSRNFRHVVTAVCVLASQPAVAATITHTEVATVSASTEVVVDAAAVIGQPVVGGLERAEEKDSEILQFPGFDPQLGRLDTVTWDVSYSGGASTDLLSACTVIKGLPFVGCRSDADIVAGFLADADAVEFSAPGAFDFVPLLTSASGVWASVTSTSDPILCGILGGVNGPCADADSDSQVASTRTDRNAMRDAYLRDFIAVTIDGELNATLDVTCTGISVLAICQGNSRPRGEGTFEISLEYGYTPAQELTPIPLGPTLPMSVAGLAAVAGLRTVRASPGR